jgi:hypothetical protein
MKLLKTTGWQGFLGTLLASPITILMGIFYILPFVLFKQYKFKRRAGWLLEFEVIEGTWAERTIWKHWAGMSVGTFNIYTKYYVDHEKVIKHERRHSQQVFTLSIFQPIVYGIHVLYIYFFQKDKHPYLDCVFERDARKASGQPVEIPREKWYWGPDDRWPWW